MIKFRYMEYALALAEYGSFKRAALELHISQPALSKGIAALEEELGVAVFDRSSHPLQPTASGRLVLEEARRSLLGQRKLREQLLKLHGGLQGSLRVAFGPYAGAVFPADFARAFHREYPGVELHVQTRAWNRLARLLRNREVDLFVGDVEDPLLHREFEVLPVTQGEVQAFYAASHPLGKSSCCSLEEIFQFPLALCGAPEWAQKFIRQQMRDYDPRESPAILRVDDYRLIRELVLTGEYCTLGPRRFFEPETERGIIRAFKLPVAPVTKAGIALRKNELRTPELNQAISILTSL